MMAFRSVIISRIPMVIILGATGTGKTKLGVELAQKFGTEIISADSMQIYKGLDVVTAKASRQEREMARHHLLDILEPHQIFTVVDFRDRALKIIDNLIQQNKLPIVVGGTNYYIESIVYNILVERTDDSGETNSDDLLWDKSGRKRCYNDDQGSHEAKKMSKDNEQSLDSAEKSQLATKSEDNVEQDEKKVADVGKSIEKLHEDAKNLTNEQIHAKLEAVDPEMAKRLHPNNRRKVLRSIEVWMQTGRRHSEILAEQKLSEGQLRKPGATIIFWLKCEQKVHEARLDARVDSMLDEGLIDELLDFHARHNKQRIQDGQPPDYTKGIFQTLGFKEFHEYLMMSEEERSSEAGKALLQQSIENMKLATRRYARRQNKMIRGRFLEHPRREVAPIYELDTTDISKWNEEVKNKAIKIIECHMNNTPCEYQPLQSTTDEDKKKMDVTSNNYCDVCKRLIIGDKEYAIHMKSNRHMKVLKKKKLEQQQTKEKCD